MHILLLEQKQNATNIRLRGQTWTYQVTQRTPDSYSLSSVTGTDTNHDSDEEREDTCDSACVDSKYYQVIDHII